MKSLSFVVKDKEGKSHNIVVTEGQEYMARSTAENKGLITKVEGTGQDDYFFTILVKNPKNNKEIGLDYRAKKEDGSPSFPGETVQGFFNSWQLYKDVEATSAPAPAQEEGATDDRLAALGGEEETLDLTGKSEETLDLTGSTPEPEAPAPEPEPVKAEEPTAPAPKEETPEQTKAEEVKVEPTKEEEPKVEKESKVEKAEEPKEEPKSTAKSKPKSKAKDKEEDQPPAEPASSNGSKKGKAAHEWVKVPKLDKDSLSALTSEEALALFDEVNEVIEKLQASVDPLKALVRAKVEEEERKLIQMKRRLGLEVHPSDASSNGSPSVATVF